MSKRYDTAIIGNGLTARSRIQPDLYTPGIKIKMDSPTRQRPEHVDRALGTHRPELRMEVAAVRENESCPNRVAMKTLDGRLLCGICFFKQGNVVAHYTSEGKCEGWQEKPSCQ